MNDDLRVFAKILSGYNLSADDFSITRFGSGYIHKTYKLEGTSSYILQRINKNVFTRPEVIASNIKNAASFLQSNYPDYNFLTPVPSANGDQMVWDSEGFPWRIFPFFENTYTIDKVETAEQAFSGAAEFARLTYYLSDADVSRFKETIARFHDLSLRYDQLEAAIKNGLPDRLKKAAETIKHAKGYSYLVDRYSQLISSSTLQLRVTHNDTKINNVLFDSSTGKAVTAIDLDTLMPGYFIYDIGDMIRTFVSPADENENDLSKIAVRKDIYEAIVNGYLSQMGKSLSAQEKEQIPFSGMMMTYIMAIRMLADYLLGDVYYHITYSEQNFDRAGNQLTLLDRLKDFNESFTLPKGIM
jgi:Ser/Thr protein kinase RdoA (MazF antagonist)